jgi:hypothetical protein
VNRTVASAVVTVAVVTGLTQSVLPDQRSTTPEGRRQQLVEQASDARERDVQEMRARGNAVGEATYRDDLRSREVRAGERLSRSLLRRVP